MMGSSHHETDTFKINVQGVLTSFTFTEKCTSLALKTSYIKTYFTRKTQAQSYKRFLLTSGDFKLLILDISQY